MKKYSKKFLFRFRKSYEYGVLFYKNLPKNPLILFSFWLKDAFSKNIADPNSMCLSSVNSKGKPFQRIVLLKDFNETGMIFYTNLKSRKSKQLRINPNVSLLFYWNILERQVIVSGKVSQISQKKVKKYFYTRPYCSQIGTWASRQSQKIANRNFLEKKFLKLKKKFKKEKKIPFPKFWGGFKVSINTMEFWQGRKNRLHDRFLYSYKNKIWKINRLSP